MAKMRVYVSGPSKDVQLVHHVVKRIEAEGFENSYDWTERLEAETSMTEEELGASIRKDLWHAGDDAEAMVVLITSASGPTPGCAAEIGARFYAYYIENANPNIIYVELVEATDGPWEHHPLRFASTGSTGDIGFSTRRVQTVDAAIQVLRSLRAELQDLGLCKEDEYD